MLEEVWVDGARKDLEIKAQNWQPKAATNLPSHLEVGPGMRRVEFHYTALSFTAPERVRFRYRLDGLDLDWVEAGGRRVAEYSQLSPGQYRFHVTACNEDGVWSQERSRAGVHMPAFCLANRLVSDVGGCNGIGQRRMGGENPRYR